MTDVFVSRESTFAGSVHRDFGEWISREATDPVKSVYTPPQIWPVVRDSYGAHRICQSGILLRRVFRHDIFDQMKASKDGESAVVCRWRLAF